MSSDFYNRKVHKARKEHKCELCRRTINKGENYVSCAECYCDDFDYYCLHEKCHKLRELFIYEEKPVDYTWTDIVDWCYDSFCRDCKSNHSCNVKNIFDCKKIWEVVNNGQHKTA